jgi:biotin operon repressor
MRAERLVALLFTLQSRQSATIAELAAALGVSKRTMHRDVAALRDAGVPLWTEPGRHGGVRLLEGWRTRLDGLTSREAVTIFAMGVPRALAELGLGTAMLAARAKVSAALWRQCRDSRTGRCAGRVRGHRRADGRASPVTGGVGGLAGVRDLHDLAPCVGPAAVGIGEAVDLRELPAVQGLPREASLVRIGGQCGDRASHEGRTRR